MVENRPELPSEEDLERERVRDRIQESIQQANDGNLHEVDMDELRLQIDRDPVEPVVVDESMLTGVMRAVVAGARELVQQPRRER